MTTKTFKIAVIGGDGTGPEVVAESLKVLQAVSKKFPIHFEFNPLNYGGTRYIQDGVILTDQEVDKLRDYDAILLGAIGHPAVKPGILERGILLKLRFYLDLYINLRPIKLYDNVESPIRNMGPKEIDYVVVRENTGGLYTGVGSVQCPNTPQEVATESMVYTYAQVKRCLEYAFNYARNRHKDQPWRGLSQADLDGGYRSQLTLCGKSNVLTRVFGLWLRVIDELKPLYLDVKTDYVHVDACCIYMIENPARFDVIVTSNMFGDIITDLAAITQGGLGVAPGANINPHGVSMFEPIGGTAPQFTGLNQINPLASIGSAALMLDHLGCPEAAMAIEKAIQVATRKMTSMAAAKMGYSTTEVGDIVASAI